MGIGEAAVTILSEDGVPTPVVHTRLRAPASRMGPADDVEGAAKASPLFAKYGTRAEAESAREKLAARMEARPSRAGARGPSEAPRAASASRRRDGPQAAPTRSATSSRSREGKALQKKVMRGVFGMLSKRL